MLKDYIKKNRYLLNLSELERLAGLSRCSLHQWLMGRVQLNPNQIQKVIEVIKQLEYEA